MIRCKEIRPIETPLSTTDVKIIRENTGAKLLLATDRPIQCMENSSLCDLMLFESAEVSTGVQGFPSALKPAQCIIDLRLMIRRDCWK
jgi:hypothetical protein